MKNFSRLLFNLFLAFLITGAVSCSKSKPLTDGTFTGTGAGHSGDITVSITVKDGRVTDAKIVSESETPGIGPVAEQQILERFLQEQKTDTIDVVSGATISSNAVLDALDMALSKSRGTECGPAIHHTMGGLKINPKAEVQNKSGNTVPGLYAAGEVTGGVHGANRLGGNAVADICIFGKIAADSAVEYINR